MLGKMRRQLLRYCHDALDDAGFKFPRPEIALHRLADFLPARTANFCIDAAIGDDLDLAVGQQQIDQHAVVVGGVPDPQMRKNIQRALPRRLILEQRLAIQRAFHHEADLAGMGGLARLDRLFDRSQYLARKNPAGPPMIVEKMLADALDAHIFTGSSLALLYQLPDAPPPPKLPPPPLKEPLSLLLEPPPDHAPPPPTTQPPPPPAAAGVVMPPPTTVTTEARMPASAETISEPKTNHATSPIKPPVVSEPNSRPKMPRMTPPSTRMAMMVNVLSGLRSQVRSELCCCCCRCGGAGNGSPSMTPMIRSTPAEIPPAKSPLRNFGVMISSMMRLVVTSGSAPSRP